MAPNISISLTDTPTTSIRIAVEVPFDSEAAPERDRAFGTVAYIVGLLLPTEEERTEFLGDLKHKFDAELAKP